MRIAYISETYPPEINGVSLTVERSVRHLRRSGHSVLLVRPAQAGEKRGRDCNWPPERDIAGSCGDAADEWRTAGLPIPLYPDLRMGLAGAAALRKGLGAFGAEHVHVATQGPLGHMAVTAARALGAPVTSDFRTNFDIYCRHYGLGFAGGLVMRHLRRFHNGTDATFVPCRALRAQLLAKGFERVEVLGRGVDAQQFAPAQRSDALRAQWGAAPDTPMLLCVSRLAAEKNLPLALQAFEAARAVRPDTQLVLVGDGPLRRRLQARHPQVHFAGMQRGEALAAHYASADVFLFPSLSETFGNVTLEAMASGLAVVAFDRAAAGELIGHGRNGWRVPVGDAPAFVRAVCDAVAAAPAALAPLREHARRTALACDWEPLLRRFERRLAALAPTPEAMPHATVA